MNTLTFQAEFVFDSIPDFIKEIREAYAEWHLKNFDGLINTSNDRGKRLPQDPTIKRAKKYEEINLRRRMHRSVGRSVDTYFNSMVIPLDQENI